MRLGEKILGVAAVLRTDGSLVVLDRRSCFDTYQDFGVKASVLQTGELKKYIKKQNIKL